jgi:hypothetical protein
MPITGPDNKPLILGILYGCGRKRSDTLKNKPTQIAFNSNVLKPPKINLHTHGNVDTPTELIQTISSAQRIKIIYDTSTSCLTNPVVTK